MTLLTQLCLLLTGICITLISLFRLIFFKSDDTDIQNMSEISTCSRRQLNKAVRRVMRTDRLIKKRGYKWKQPIQR
mgnify:CR=1 FL=1